MPYNQDHYHGRPETCWTVEAPSRTGPRAPPDRTAAVSVTYDPDEPPPRPPQQSTPRLSAPPRPYPLNADSKLRGRIDTPLDSIGRLEAVALGELFATVPLAAIVASPLSRAVDTAAAVASRHQHLRVEVDAGLSDRDWGTWAGHPETELVERFGRLDDAPGIEDAETFRHRTVGAIERLAERAEHRAVLAVAHDAVNGAILASLIAELATAPRIEQHTGCWNHLLNDDHRWSAEVVNALPGDGRRP